MVAEWDVAQIAEVDLAVEEGGHLTVGWSNLVGTKGLTPDGEEVTEGIVVPLHRRLDVNDPVFGVGVQPVEAATGPDKWALRGLLDGSRWDDTNPVGDLAGSTIDEDGEVGVDVEDDLLVRIAGNPVHNLASRVGTGGGQSGHRWCENAFGSKRTGLGW